MTTTVRRAVTVLIALVLATLSLAGPANAAADPSQPGWRSGGQQQEARAGTLAYTDCPYRYTCLWATTNYTGSRWQGQYSNATLPSWINNRSKSVMNNGAECRAVYYDRTGYPAGDFGYWFGIGQHEDLVAFGESDLYSSQTWWC